MNKAIRKKIEVLDKLKNDLEEMIFDKIEKVARQRNYDRMTFTHYGTSFERDGKEYDLFNTNNPINKLEDIYTEHVHHGGFEALWSKEKGWC